MPPSPEKNSDSRMIAPKSAIEPAAMTSWPNVRLDLAGVLEHRDDHAERRRREDHRDEQRRLDQPAGLEREADADREREREHASRRRRPQHAPAQARRTRSRARRGRAGRRGRSRRAPRSSASICDPAEHRRADDDAGDDLEHDRGQAHAREEPEQERRDECRRHDEQQTRERRTLHAVRRRPAQAVTRRITRVDVTNAVAAMTWGVLDALPPGSQRPAPSCIAWRGGAQARARARDRPLRPACIAGRIRHRAVR